MTIHELTSVLEAFAPLSLQESYDNSGLIVGEPDADVSGALIALEITDDVINEALSLNYNLIIVHHPLIFKGLRKINNNDMTGRLVKKCIKNDIAVYAAHTNLDNIKAGVNQIISDRIGLQHTEVLSSPPQQLRKLAVFVPHDHAEKLRKALFEAGAGNIGNYDSCSFNIEGSGTFRALEGADPFTGNIGEIHSESETRVEVIFPYYQENKILMAMRENHPYEEVAFDVFKLENDFKGIGAGMTGMLEKPENTVDFLKRIKRTFGAKCIRHSKIINENVQKIAVCGGSGSFLAKAAIAKGADVFITGDVKYHEFFDADNKILIADIGHYESEQFTKELLMNIIKKNFSTFAVQISAANTNPINYF
jgi:dinuclear metal center YbgI/SA1388 family protein